MAPGSTTAISRIDMPSRPAIRLALPLSGFVLLLAGCAANYKPAEGQPTAELRFKTKTVISTDVVGLWTVKPQACPKIEKTRLLTGKETSETYKSVQIEAGRPFLVQAEHVSFWLGKECHARVVFTPQPGYTYNLGSTLTAQGCKLEMMRFIGNVLSFEPSLRQVSDVPEDELCRVLK